MTEREARLNLGDAAIDDDTPVTVRACAGAVEDVSPELVAGVTLRVESDRSREARFQRPLDLHPAIRIGFEPELNEPIKT